MNHPVRMYAHRIAWTEDPMVIVGCSVPALVQLPIEILGPRLEGCRIDRSAQDDGKAADPPKLFTDWLEALPEVHALRTGPVIPLDPSHPAYAQVLAAAREDVAVRRGLAAGKPDTRKWLHGPPQPQTGPARLGPFDHRSEHFACLLELVCRSYAIPFEDALAALAGCSPHGDDFTRTLIAAAYLDGYARPRNLADEIIGAHDRDAAHALRAQEARARIEAQARAAKPRTGVYTLTNTTRANPDDPLALSRSIGAERPIPPGKSYLHSAGLPGYDGFLRPGLEMSTAVPELTDSQYRDAGPLGEGIALAIAECRHLASDGKTYDECALLGDIRLPENRHALESMQARAAQLVHAMQNGGSAAACGFAERCLLTIGIAYGGRVNAQVCVDVIAEALADFVQRQRAGNWQSIMAAETVPNKMLAALREPSPWLWGELVTEPTDEDRQRLERALDPSAWRRTILKAIDGLSEIPSKAVYCALHVAGLVASKTPSAADRSRVAAVLQSEGLTKAEVSDKTGRRRVWVRLPPTATAATDGASPS